MKNEAFSRPACVLCGCLRPVKTIARREEKLPGWKTFCNFAPRKAMKRRRYIALLLSVVYLLATGGAACLSLTCGCLAAEHAAEHVHHVHVHAHAGCAAAHSGEEALDASCCCDRHSTDIELYTAASGDESPCRCAVLALPHCLAAAQAARLAAPKFRKERIASPPVAVPTSPYLGVAGLRAPPVSA